MPYPSPFKSFQPEFCHQIIIFVYPGVRSHDWIFLHSPSPDSILKLSQIARIVTFIEQEGVEWNIIFPQYPMLPQKMQYFRCLNVNWITLCTVLNHEYNMNRSNTDNSNLLRIETLIMKPFWGPERYKHSMYEFTYIIIVWLVSFNIT